MIIHYIINNYSCLCNKYNGFIHMRIEKIHMIVLYNKKYLMSRASYAFVMNYQK